jgi:hypothetical protein
LRLTVTHLILLHLHLYHPLNIKQSISPAPLILIAIIQHIQHIQHNQRNYSLLIPHYREDNALEMQRRQLSPATAALVCEGFLRNVYRGGRHGDDGVAEKCEYVSE